MKNLIACLTVCVLSCTAVATTWTVDDDVKADFDSIKIQKQTNVIRNGNLLAYDLVVGETGSYSVIAVDLDTMTTETIWSSLQSKPRGIAMTQDGDIFLAMNTPETHIVKLDWTGTNWEYEDFSDPIGSWGPGKLGVDDQERLIVTGDNTHYVYIYDPNTGDLLDSFTHSGTGNIVGLRVVDSKAYVLEIFGDRVWVGDLVTNPIQTEVVLQDSNLDYSHGLALDNDGRLYIANYNASKIEVYDISSGDWIESWITPDRPSDIYFSSPHQLFAVSSATGLFIINQEGMVIEKLDIEARSINRWTLTYIDEDADGIPDKKDNCYLYNPDQADCNGNEIGDVCDIADQVSMDCNLDSVPDECQLADNDCNSNGIPDECELGSGTSATCVDGLSLAGVNLSTINEGCNFENLTVAAGCEAGTTTIILDEDSTTGDQDAGVNIISIGVSGVADDEALTDLVVKAINGTTDPRITFATDGNGESGIGGITAAEGSSTTQITLTMDQVGTAGNIASVLTELAGGADMVEVADFTGGSEFGSGTSATATITGILDTSGIPAALHGETITLIDNAGSPVTKTYKFMNSSTTNGAIDGGDGYIHIAIQGEDSNEGLVDNIEQAVEHANGHNGSISVSRSGAVLTLTQGTTGPGGNTTITFSAGINTSTEISKTDFTGGSEFGSGTSATATVTITDFAELNTGDKVNLIATDLTNYDFVCGDQSSVLGTWESTTSNDATATNLMNVINTSSGPAGTRFNATVSGAVITITQAIAGTGGNTAITLTDSGTAGMSKTDFTGGSNNNDQNGNGILDECECHADVNEDGNVNVNDILILIGNWGSNSEIGDVNFDGIVDVTDLLIVVGNWGPCE